MYFTSYKLDNYIINQSAYIIVSTQTVTKRDQIVFTVSDAVMCLDKTTTTKPHLSSSQFSYENVDMIPNILPTTELEIKTCTT